ncbi:GNAT family N-acetyltransferase [Rathayibacter sp. YIM 133350]|uniref:GNAT family N-acetyltransferase n=1 Tax=Rathayibacter sp. YIM 133350 TaxID=3131992 RepID=UPI00307EFFC9
MAAFALRAATASDARLLTDMMVEAANWDRLAARNRVEVIADSAHSRYVMGWKRPSDEGVVAVDTEVDESIGACWFRLFPTDAPGYGFVAVGVPELILGVKPYWRAQGVGRALLRETIGLAARRGYNRIALSVESGNHAVNLYRSEGFAPVARVGTRETMVKNLR